MSSGNARRPQPISVDDYLAGEQIAKRKYEYAAGRVYAMAGARYTHNLIASRITGELYGKLKKSKCEVLGSDSKVRIDLASGTWMYYPDVSVVCGDDIIDEVYQTAPAIVVEVLSNSTRRADEGEKQVHYLQLDSLKTYLLFEQELACAIVFERTSDGFERLVYEGLDAIIPLPAIGINLALAEIYAGVNFVKEPEAEFEVNETT
jgi:Uma2 family endonuclease